MNIVYYGTAEMADDLCHIVERHGGTVRGVGDCGDYGFVAIEFDGGDATAIKFDLPDHGEGNVYLAEGNAHE
jgi:hypothetical protein